MSKVASSEVGPILLAVAIVLVGVLLGTVVTPGPPRPRVQRSHRKPTLSPLERQEGDRVASPT